MTGYRNDLAITEWQWHPWKQTTRTTKS